ncbi:hypothetical protein K443DRAFT_671871 [Laccaria amethystina LaAM-08-1]|uniref:Altered inheritance of mitochondria protein 41 n=1 Tax=Laccaria amethystina LaAM-08-1 TaxID=1095629 RepID=A0A0C9Y5Y3_9AGAR|nr:hypothetical protein K443DRAFT_671871 [Laccaria amethystina LaAM-08-1]
MFLRACLRRCSHSLAPPLDIRSHLMAQVKGAMKSKDAFTSNTLRSVLSEVYAADKTANDKVPSPIIASIIHKAIIRRTEAASKFLDASRSDLADNETREATLLMTFLPPLMSEADMDNSLKNIIDSLTAGGDVPKTQALIGLVFKEFYGRVDKSNVDPIQVKRRAEVLISENFS